MGNDMEKMVEMLMGMLGSNNEKSDSQEIIAEPNDDEELNEIGDETYIAEKNNDNEIENLFGGFSGGKDKRVTLLSSIKPYMNGKRQEKIDTAINALRLLTISSGLGFNFFDKR